MTGKTHMAIGIVAALTVSVGQPIENQLVLVAASVIGSLIPDLDHPKAKLNQKLLFIKNEIYRVLFYLSLAIGFIYLYFLTENNIFGLLGIVTLFIGLSSHRGFTHSIIGFLTVSYMVKLMTAKYNLSLVYSGFIIGYVLHLLADFFTIKGVRLFFPLKTNISSPIIIKPNSEFEDILFVLLTIYSIFLLYNFIKI
ncbi:metal-dependent hydrolase [Tissierella sp.]|uniref:metal-dependent hydrolase n=1 Tax=Tissierella sp. TaxID=41274 RepID=UPI00285A4583|nr:metal-dependent hydrolase [Tissierella sp.]MDR7855647.1 metal-dependent hydrolase [Tissierella sp.]